MNELFLKAQSGDERAIEELMIRYDGLIRHIMKKFGYSTFDEDMHSIGMFRLWRAIMTFNAHDEVGKFTTYAGILIDQGILGEIRKKKTKKRQLFNHALSLEHEYCEGFTVENTLADHNSLKEFVDVENAVLSRCNDVLTELEQQLLRYYILECRSRQEVFEIVNYKQSQPTFSRQIIAIKAKLAEVLKDDYLEYVN